MLVVTHADVMDLLPMAQCIEVVEAAMIASARGEIQQPIRTVLATPHGAFGLMPGVPKSDVFGVKVLSVFERGPENPFQPHQGVVLLFNADDGLPAAVIDAGAVTQLRTAAASAVATRALAIEDARIMAVLGNGVQAAAHIDAIRLVRALKEIRVWGRDMSRTAAFAARHTSPGLPVRPAATISEALADADIVCTTTASPSPILAGRQIRPGLHLNVVGSSTAATREIDDRAVAMARFFVDRREGVLAQGGEFRSALAAGLVDASHILGEIGDVIDGRVPGRRSASDVTIYKSLGLIAQDLYTGAAVLAAARRAGRGVEVDFRSRR